MPPRVLHLIDEASRQASPTTLALIASTRRHAPGEHDVLLLGGARLARHAQAAGLADTRRIPVPSGRAPLGYAAVRRALAGEHYDVIHCWSLGAAYLARMLRPGTPTILSLTCMPGPHAMPWLRRLAARRGRRLAITAISEALRQALRDADPLLDARVIPPAIETDAFDPASRPATRDTWNLLTPDTLVIGLVGDPPTAADARTAILALGLANESLTSALRRSPRMLLLMHPDQFRRASARRLMDIYGHGELLDQEPDLAAPWRVLPALDAVLALNPAAGGLALRWAMAAGLPIVAEADPSTEEAIDNERTGLLAERGQPKRLAHRLHQMLFDVDLRQRLGAAARTTARERYSPAACATAIASLYESLGTASPSLAH